MPPAVITRYSRRAQRDTQNRRDRPRHQQRRDIDSDVSLKDRRVHAAIDQHLLERAAAADDQQHHGDNLMEETSAR